jgi:carbamoyl-phosphate synthase/aspartate carbamoyltransferase/dihydroorotase
LTYPLIGNYGVPDDNEIDEYGIKKWVESHRIWAAGLVIGELSKKFSHYNAKKSLHDWLAENNIPGIENIDTRVLTKQLRTNGTLLGKIIHDPLLLKQQIKFDNPNLENLVEQVSIKESKIFNPNGKLKIMMVDCGVKYNQIRCFLKRNVRIELVPWNFKFQDHLNQFDGLFLSNGPGDPMQCKETINNLKAMLNLDVSKPIFGICLGHQLLSLAAGAQTYKMEFGNRGQNLPCLFYNTGSCFVTSQNHGYAVDSKTLDSKWKQLFFNANDNSNEGIVHVEKPFFSVQFHPEHHPGPDDMEFLFDVFIQKIENLKNSNQQDKQTIVELIEERVKSKIKYKIDKQSLKKYRKVLILGK